MKQETLNLQECNSTYVNILGNNNPIGRLMSKKVKCPEQLHQHTMKLIFQFPAKSMEDEVVKNEIKDILASALKEQIGKTTS